MKRCCTCKLEKEIESFGKNKSRPDGLAAQCKPCALSANRASYAKDPLTKNAKGKAWYAENKDRHKVMRQEWRLRNLEEQRAKNRAQMAANPEKQRAAEKAYKAANPHRVRTWRAKNRAAKLQRTPKWLTLEDFKNIELFYLMAKALSDATGILHEVDHELPMQGQYVSGLHVPGNLQILPRSENRSKNNRWLPE